MLTDLNHCKLLLPMGTYKRGRDMVQMVPGINSALYIYIYIYMYILAVPDPALLGFDYFPIYYLLIIVIPDFALLAVPYTALLGF